MKDELTQFDIRTTSFEKHRVTRTRTPDSFSVSVTITLFGICAKAPGGGLLSSLVEEDEEDEGSGSASDVEALLVSEVRESTGGGAAIS